MNKIWQSRHIQDETMEQLKSINSFYISVALYVLSVEFHI